MIDTSDDEKDLYLKLKFMRLLWHLGYFVRKNIEVSRYDLDRKEKQFTDIDVVGIKFDSDLNTSIIICDCKSGYKGHPAERIFWLSGLMKSINADRGFFVKEKMEGRLYYELAENLRIIPMNLNQLDETEKTYNINPELFFGPFRKEQGLISSFLKQLNNINKRIFEYISYKYWFAIPSEQILTLMSICFQIKNYKTIDHKVKSFLLGYIYSLLAVSLIKFSKIIFYISNENKEQIIKENLMGGRLEYLQRKKLIGSFLNFMKHEIKLKYNQIYPISKTLFIESILPKYVKYLVDFIIRICKSPKSAKYLPQIIDLFAYDYLIFGNEFKNEYLDINNKEYETFINILKNYIAFIERSGIITDEIKESFKKFLLKFKNK